VRLTRECAKTKERKQQMAQMLFRVTIVVVRIMLKA
jgi:hypothetical protein